MKKTKKLSALLAALTLAFVFASCSHSPNNNYEPEPQATKVSIDSIDGLYYFDYEGDYKLEDCISANLKTEDDLLAYLQTFTWWNRKPYFP